MIAISILRLVHTLMIDSVLLHKDLALIRTDFSKETQLFFGDVLDCRSGIRVEFWLLNHLDLHKWVMFQA